VCVSWGLEQQELAGSFVMYRVDSPTHQVWNMQLLDNMHFQTFAACQLQAVQCKPFLYYRGKGMLGGSLGTAAPIVYMTLEFSVC